MYILAASTPLEMALKHRGLSLGHWVKVVGCSQYPMASQRMSSIRFLVVVVLSALTCRCYGSDRKVHVVYMGGLPKEGVSASSHHGMLGEILGSDSKAEESLIYSYSRSFNGFAARLTDEEAARFSEKDEVVSVLPNTKLQLHTTRSWDFMGFTQNHTLRRPCEKDIIVGMLDTGIWPESESFDDDGLGPPPAQWKGICQTEGNNFTCNNKIIGARYYNSENFYGPKDFKSPRDSEGHGTHTSSTAAGRAVAGASYFGLAEGVARGAVPKARIAVYKVCWSDSCWLADILAAFDDAIADGVDVISVSLGSDFPLQYFEDPIAIGSFHAMKKGILTSNSAGNSGPSPYSVSNYAPWSLTVAASSIDRKFVSQVVLGNGKTYIGNAINSFELNGTVFPLVYGGDAVNVSAGSSSLISSFCVPGTMNSIKVRGKLVVCNYVFAPPGILEAEGLGTIMSTAEDSDVAFSYPLPATVISPEDAAEVVGYIKSTSNPIGTIQAGETWVDALAPVVVSFSSRGPSPITPDILKPDLTAPGVDILASWSPVASPSFYDEDHRSVKFNIISGTSMSCPHASGAAAYIKSVHPDWSPAAIKSALMTTATIMDAQKNDDAEFAYGSGHINPLRAVDPGLIFDASEADYIDFLCSQGYNTSTLRRVTGDNSSYCSGSITGKVWDLNYPSFALSVLDGQLAVATFHRTVTNVGSPNSTYQAFVSGPSCLRITVQPSVLSFSSIGEKKSFVVKVDGGVLFQQPIMSACIVWTDKRHSVRTPLVVYTALPSGALLIDDKLASARGFSLPHRKGLFKHG